MTLFLRTVSLLLCAIGVAPLQARSPFDGRWRIDTSSMDYRAKPETITLRDGMFKLEKGGDDEAAIRADGAFHAVDGHGYIDESSISVRDDYRVHQVDRIRGKTIYIVDYIVSPDGNRLTSAVTSFANPTGQPVRTETIQQRIEAAPIGAHRVSGKWQREKLIASPASDWRMKLDGNRFSWWSLQGTGYEAVIGGARVRIKGDEAGNFAAITMPRNDTVVESDSEADGTVGATMSMRLVDDRTIQAETLVVKSGQRSTFYLRRQ